MAALKLIGFSGEIPRIQARQLPDTGAQRAMNVRLEDGSLTPINELEFNASIASLGLPEVQTIYLWKGKWLAWQKIVKAAPAPIADDRLYFMGDGTPKMMVGASIYDLAVPLPNAALSVAQSGTGTGDVYTRLYVYTFVTEFSEESEPCPASASISWQAGKTVTLSGFQAPANEAGKKRITKQRIYRSQTGSSGQTKFYFIAERDASTADFIDNVAINNFAEILPSRDFNAPLDTLNGLVAMPNGMMAAFSGKDVYFSEPWQPHAWPQKYSLTCDFDIVALGVYGSVLVIATKGMPYIAVGTSPDSMAMQRIETNLPCLSARSMVDLGYAVAYAGSDGLVVVSNGVARVVTDQLFTKNQWLRTNPQDLIGSQHNGRYVGSYRYVDEETTLQEGTFLIDLTGSYPFLVRASTRSNASFYDVTSGFLYFLDKVDIYRFDPAGTTPAQMNWKSKKFIFPWLENLGVIFIDGGKKLSEKEKQDLADLLAEIAAANAITYAGKPVGSNRVVRYIPKRSYINGAGFNSIQTHGLCEKELPWKDTVLEVVYSMGAEINAAPVNTFAVNGDPLIRHTEKENIVAVTIYADGEIVAVVSDMNEIVRLPSGFKARQWEVEISGRSVINQIDLATTATELKQV